MGERFRRSESLLWQALPALRSFTVERVDKIDFVAESADVFISQPPEVILLSRPISLSIECPPHRSRSALSTLGLFFARSLLPGVLTHTRARRGGAKWIRSESQ